MTDQPHQPQEPQRLSKRVAAQVPCSRSEAEQYIAQGWVSVDGKQVLEPQCRVIDSQQVVVDAKARLQPALPATFVLHKPAGLDLKGAEGLLAGANHWVGDTSGVRRVKSHAVGLKPLLVLPPAASGLTVFSQDPRILRKLTEDAALIEQELVAEVRGTIAEDGLARLCAGLRGQGKPMPPARVSWQSETRLRFAVKGIAPASIPWMCEQVGLQVTSLRRLRIGRIAMAALPVGQWRYLGAAERF